MASKTSAMLRGQALQKINRGDWIRTSDPPVPKPMLDDRADFDPRGKFAVTPAGNAQTALRPIRVTASEAIRNSSAHGLQEMSMNSAGVRASGCFPSAKKTPHEMASEKGNVKIGRKIRPPQIIEKIGSSGWTRTSNPPVNSSCSDDPPPLTDGDEDPDAQ
jgi:hypothetical protein